MGGGGSPAPTLDYVCMTAVEATTFTITIGSKLSTSNYEYIEYSLDNGGTWVKTNNVNNEEVVVNIPEVAIGGSVLLRGKGKQTASSTIANYYTNITSSGLFDLSGNIMSLLALDDYADAEPSVNYTFVYLFRGSKVRYADGFTLHVGTLRNYIYQGLFYECSSLVIAPPLHLTSTTNYCCYSMFRGCSSLVSIDVVFPATVSTSCYQQMFTGCANLVLNPVLPSTTLVTNCYSSMFQDCAKINYIKAMFTTAPTSSYCYYWVSGVSATGTFVKNSAATWTDTFGVNAIPTGWTVQTASE